MVIYNETTCQEAHKLQHQEAVTFLEFGRITEVPRISWFAAGLLMGHILLGADLGHQDTSAMHVRGVH